VAYRLAVVIAPTSTTDGSAAARAEVLRSPGTVLADNPGLSPIETSFLTPEARARADVAGTEF
jgi:hypothetical protein